jgi:uncharacterized membrane protein
MTHINEFGEIIRDKDPNDKSQESITFFEGFFVFIYNYLFFIPGLILYSQHKKKGYTKKARQVGTITAIEFGLFVLLIIMIAAAS